METPALAPQGALSLWETNPKLAMLAAMRGRGLFGAMAMRDQAALDREAQKKKEEENAALYSSAPQGEILSPADLMRHRAQVFANARRLDEAKKFGEIAKQLDNDLEFRDGVWYDKRTGKPYAAGHGINQQGFGYGTTISPEGQISVAPLPGADRTFGMQQNIGEAARAQYDLQTVPATSPTSPPTYASRMDLLRGRQPAGMSPVQQAQVQADAAQATEVSKNYGNIFNNLQNASMANPAKMAKLQQIGTLLGDFEGGKFSEAGLDLAKAFNSLGLKIDPRLPNKEAATALANEVALENRSTATGAGMPGAMSDADREFLKQMGPQMSQTPDGRRSIINARVKVMERENQVASKARAYRQKYGKLDDNFFSQLQSWADRNRIFK